MDKKTTRCIRCLAEYTDKETVGLKCCPNCKTTDIPLDIAKDITLNINIQELRILCFWADGYARIMDDKNLDDPNHKSLKETINILSARIKEQFPKKFKEIPLTWKDEMDLLEKAGVNASYYIEGKEQI